MIQMFSDIPKQLTNLSWGHESIFQLSTGTSLKNHNLKKYQHKNRNDCVFYYCA